MSAAGGRSPRTDEGAETINRQAMDAASMSYEDTGGAQPAKDRQAQEKQTQKRQSKEADEKGSVDHAI